MSAAAGPASLPALHSAMPPQRQRHGPHARALPVLLALLALAFAPAAARAAPWADLPSELPQDPALTLGALPNGLRYALLPNAEPAARVSLRLLVSAGSMHEGDNERGLAHFTEHMAFRGTRGRPHGELVAALERMGISFGPDSAAFTGYDSTIYHLDLPDASEATLREALRIFREYASGIEFDPGDIERERGVILSEMAMRDTGPARASLRQFAFAWPSARENERVPIGLEKQIRRFTQKQFRAFYDAWYRPERIAIIAVGAIEPAALRAMIGEEFGDFSARAPARPEPPGLGATAGRASKKLPALEVFTSDEITGFTVSHLVSELEKETPLTRASLVRNLHETLACYLLQRRMLLLSRKPDAPTGTASVATGQTVPGLRVTSFVLGGNLDKWETVLATAEQSLRAALEHGFTKGELDAVKTAFAVNWRQAVRFAPTRQSGDLCAQLAVFLLKGGGFTAPADMWGVLEQPLADATPADCHAALARLWGGGATRIFITANKSFSQIKRAQIEKVLAASRRIPAASPDDDAPVGFAYDDFGAPGRILSSSHVPDIDAHLLKFANNVLVNFKNTAFEKNTVLANVRIGFGRITQPPHQPGIDLLASAGLMAGGLGRHGAADISRISEEHMIDIDFAVDNDAFNFSVRCPSGEFHLALKMITAFVTDAAYRAEGKALASAEIATYFQQKLSSPGACINSVVERVITRDSRFGWPSFDESHAYNMIHLRAWLSPVIAAGDIEMSIVGDIARDDAVATAAATLGALPARPARGSTMSGGVRKVVFAAQPSPILVPVSAAFRQGAFSFVWPVPGKNGLHHDRACHLLAAALANNVRACLREQLGAAYDVSAEFVQHDGFDEFNYLMVRAEVDRAALEKASAAVRRAVAEFAAKGVNEDEFLRAKKPFADKYEQWMRTNAYWCYTVLRDAQTNPMHLAAAQNRIADVAGITRDEVNALAARHLVAERAYFFKTTPEKK